MADYYKNSDYYGCDTMSNRCCDNGQPSNPAQGIDYTVIIDLVEEPVTLDFFKLHCRVDYNTDDELMSDYLKSARQFLEQWSQLSFGEKTIRFTALKLPDNWKLMFGPYKSNALLFKDTLKKGGSEIDIELETEWPNLPETIKIAICMEAASQYMLREGVILNINGSIQTSDQAHDLALMKMQPFANISWP